jgi:hypothetical protein
MMDEGRARDTGRLALAIGVVAVGSAVSIAAFFAVRGPLGTINDIGNGALGALSGWLAWRVRDELDPAVRSVAVGAAVAGAAITVVGSVLVVSGTTGYFFASLVSTFGFAAIGVWLVVLNLARGDARTRPSGLRRAGVVAGALMVVGVATAPGILLRLDDAATAPGWAWIAMIGWLGTYVVYPIWAIWTGIVETRRLAAPARNVTAGSTVAE